MTPERKPQQQESTGESVGELAKRFGLKTRKKIRTDLPTESTRTGQSISSEKTVSQPTKPKFYKCPNPNCTKLSTKKFKCDACSAEGGPGHKYKVLKRSPTRTSLKK